MINLITPAQKDAVLHLLFEMSKDSREVTSAYAHFQHIVTFKQLEQILKLFSRLGLIDLYHLYDIDIHIELRAEADQFIQQGGFYGQYELFKNSVTRLLLEVERLENAQGADKKEVNDIGKKISEYISLIANLTSISGVVLGEPK
jgi:hypothetical protein